MTSTSVTMLMTSGKMLSSIYTATFIVKEPHSLPVVSLEDVIRLKESLGREKDFRDIARIRAYLEATQAP